MSGYRGTIGNPEKDRVAAWIYDRVALLEPHMRKSIFKLIAAMATDRNHLHKVVDEAFKKRAAKLVRDDYIRQIDGLVGEKTPMNQRLRNLALRNYRQAIGAGISAPKCYWCEEKFLVDEPYKMRKGHKMHEDCSEEFETAEAEES